MSTKQPKEETASIDLSYVNDAGLLFETPAPPAKSLDVDVVALSGGCSGGWGQSVRWSDSIQSHHADCS